MKTKVIFENQQASIVLEAEDEADENLLAVASKSEAATVKFSTRNDGSGGHFGQPWHVNGRPARLVIYLNEQGKEKDKDVPVPG